MKLRPFELALVVIFGLLMILALILLKFYNPEPEAEIASLGGAVTIWGTLPASTIDSVLNTLTITNEGYKKVTYRYISPDKFDDTFVNALADNTPPDLLLIPHELLTPLRPRLEKVPYKDFPSFRSQYVEGSSIFALSDGIYGFPVMVDPLVMYWNEDLFSFKNILTAPQTWEEIVGTTVPELTVRDFNRVISQSALAMGEYTNIKNASPIISMLLLQGGSKMVSEAGTTYQVKLDEGETKGAVPFTTAMTFYSNFSAVSNSLYSWNRSLSLDRDAFLRDELALYFGFGSEAKELEAKNPNINFSMAQVPQGAAATTKRTYGRFYTLAVPIKAKNKTGGYMVARELAGPVNAKTLADGYSMAPVYRATLEAGSNDPYTILRYGAAIQARAWLSPAQAEVDSVFTQLIEAVTADRTAISKHVGDAASRLGQKY